MTRGPAAQGGEQRPWQGLTLGAAHITGMASAESQGPVTCRRARLFCLPTHKATIYHPEGCADAGRRGEELRLGPHPASTQGSPPGPSCPHSGPAHWSQPTAWRRVKTCPSTGGPRISATVFHGAQSPLGPTTFIYKELLRKNKKLLLWDAL